jgi:hypothetical protein
VALPTDLKRGNKDLAANRYLTQRRGDAKKFDETMVLLAQPGLVGGGHHLYKAKWCAAQWSGFGVDAETGWPVLASGPKRLFKPAWEIVTDHSPEITRDLLHRLLSDKPANRAIGRFR